MVWINRFCLTEQKPLMLVHASAIGPKTATPLTRTARSSPLRPRPQSPQSPSPSASPPETATPRRAQRQQARRFRAGSPSHGSVVASSLRASRLLTRCEVISVWRSCATVGDTKPGPSPILEIVTGRFSYLYVSWAPQSRTRRQRPG